MTTINNGIKTYHKVFLAIISAIFLFLSFMDLGFFIWFAMFPFLFSIKDSDIKHSILYSFICGFIFFAGITYWLVELYVNYIWPLALITLSLYYIIFGIAAYFILNKISNPYIRMMLIPACWVLIEFARSQTFMAFTIGILGYSQHNFLPLMHITRFTGIYGVSFIIMLFNMAIYETISFFDLNRRLNIRFIVISISLLISFAVYGISSFNQNLDIKIRQKEYNSIEIAAVQPRVLFGSKYSNKG